MLRKMITGFFVLVCGEGSPATGMSAQDFLAFIAEERDEKISRDEYERLYLEFFNNVSPMKKPELIILGGGSGSGKTTYRRKHLTNMSNFHTHDMDEVIIRLSGYQKDLQELGALKAFENWWPIAQKVVNLLGQYAFHNKVNVIYDRTCGTDASFKDLENAIFNQGYTARLFAFWVPEETALQRVKARAEKEGRIVSEKIVKEYRKKFATLFPQYMNMIPEVSVLNDEEIIMQKMGTKIKIMNHGVYNRFLDENVN